MGKQRLVVLHRPQTRAECLANGTNAQRPCSWTECRYHLESAEASCALDVAAEGPLDLGDIGDLLGVSRERARQLEVSALRKLSGYFGDGKYSLDWGGHKLTSILRN